MTEPAPLAVEYRPRAVTWRSVLLGLLGVLFICGLTPFNDFVVSNTYLVGNFLPIGLLLFFITFVMLVNTPLRLYAPAHAFSAGELAVAMGMTLISCGLPSSGLMRYLPAHLVAFWTQSSTNVDFATILREINLPGWMFPTPSGGGPVASDPVYSEYINRAPPTDSFVDSWLLVPWSAWIKPALGWGVMLACLFGAILCMTILVRRQWVENERLAFPLASLYLSLIEEPAPGKALNALFSARAFWIMASIVFLIHGVNAMHQYWQQAFPQIPLGYDLNAVFADEPWRFTHHTFKKASLYFCIIGIVYFLQSNVAFSLFFSYLAVQVVMRIIYNSYGMELTEGVVTDLSFGSLLPFAAAILWVGRQHWAMILRQMFRGEVEGEAVGRFLSYRTAGWGFVLGLVGLTLWLKIVGMSLIGAIVLVLMLFLLILIITRIVAETGLIFVQLPVPLFRPWVYLIAAGSPGPRTTLTSYTMTSWFHILFGHDLRENVSVFASHALRTADGAVYERSAVRNRAIPFTLCLVLALAVGFVVSGASMLYCEYNYSLTLDTKQDTVNNYGVEGSARAALTAATQYRPPNTGPAENHGRLSYFGAGFGITALLSYLRLQFVNWPLHPVGFLLAGTFPMGLIWFSIMIGWMAKVLIVKFGGSELYRAARPVFIGMIIGEAGAAAFWLIVNLILLSLGQPYHAIRLLPS